MRFPWRPVFVHWPATTGGCARQLSSAPLTAAATATAQPIEKLLVANRGEIACRIMRTARRMGIRTVAVYSEADKHALHVAMADEAVCIGPAPVHLSYLRSDHVLDAARRTQSSAVHPGYGLLSENADFAAACSQAHLTFVGPPPSAIRDMGVKSTSKAIMEAAGVPVIGGYHGDDQSDQRLVEEADAIGYPVMIKAVMGGGGKGMRIAMSRDDFLPQLESAKREAVKAFGDQVMLVEKYVPRPRHVEVQVFGDTRGNYVYLWERDCSVQRRHQKIIEEAPAPGLSDVMRHRLGETAVRAAQAVNYVGAGTVEFIMDSAASQFFFMEMNTRLQVEHPVTEMVTGLDLVEWQLRVASGEALPLTQNEIELKGHAFEARIYAEDPYSGFIPGAGQLRHVSTPEPSDCVRIETGVRSGDEVSVHYDPMIAKLVVWSEDRYSALLKLRQSLSQYNIAGLTTNINFLIDLAGHAEFAAGIVDTDFIQRHQERLLTPSTVSHTELCQAAMAFLLARYIQSSTVNSTASTSPYLAQTNSRFNYTYRRQMVLCSSDGRSFILTIQSNRSDATHCYTVEIDDERYQVTAQVESPAASIPHHSTPHTPMPLQLCCDIGGHMTRSRVVCDGDSVHVYGERGVTTLSLPPLAPLSATDHTTSIDGGIGGATAVAPMPGVIDKLLVTEGDCVKVGQPLLVIIAMKMEYVVKSSSDGVIEKFNYRVGDNVAKGSALVKFQSTTPSTARTS